MLWKALGVSNGVGIGHALKFTKVSPTQNALFLGVQEEKDKLQCAIQQFCTDTQELVQMLHARASEEEAQVLSAQILMLCDPSLLQEIYEAIEAGVCAAQAVEQTCERYAQMLRIMPDELMSQRAVDLYDISTRMRQLLSGEIAFSASDFSSECVVVLDELTPSIVAKLAHSKVAAIVAQKGGMVGHAAILARSLGIPAVFGVQEALAMIIQNSIVAVDGNQGIVDTMPSEAVREKYREEQKKRYEQADSTAQHLHGVMKMADGTEKHVFANVGSVVESTIAHTQGAQGIGLLRTEFLLQSSGALSCTQQIQLYEEISHQVRHAPVIARSLDIGADKTVAGIVLDADETCFLGCRGIRHSLAHPQYLEIQLRALLRANVAHRNYSLLLPMVTEVKQVRKVKAMLAQQMELLKASGVTTYPLPVGVMIETPAAVMIMPELAKEADFFSIGTNDLTQYTLAANRDNVRVAGLFSYYHPAVLRMIQHVANAAKSANLPISLCGEAASDINMIPLLLGLGIDSLSVNPYAVQSVRHVARLWTLPQAQLLAKDALSLGTTGEVHEFLEQKQLQQEKISH